MEKKNRNKSAVIDSSLSTSTLVAVCEGAYKGYKKDGVSGAIAGGIAGLITSLTGQHLPPGAV